MYFKSLFRTASLATALAGASMFGPVRPVLADTIQARTSTLEMEKPITAELKELRGLMNELNRDAHPLQTLVHSGYHWESHASQLNQIKDHVNRLGNQLESLQNMRFSAASWQQEAIDSVAPVAVEVADRTNAAIEHLNENQQHLWAPQYVDHLRTIPVLCNQMRGLVDNHLKIADAREKVQDIQGELAGRLS